MRRPARGPVNTNSVVGHLLFGLGAKDVRDVWVAGERVLENGVVLAETPARVEQVQADAQRLWMAFEKETAR